MSQANGVVDYDVEERALDERLAQIREARTAKVVEKDRAERLREKQAAIELEELRDRFEGEGEEGIDFAICDLTRIGRGFVVVKKGPAALVRKFKSTVKADRPIRDADAADLVRPNLLHPSKEEFRAIADAHDFVVGKLADVICDMHGVGLELKQKK